MGNKRQRFTAALAALVIGAGALCPVSAAEPTQSGNVLLGKSVYISDGGDMFAVATDDWATHPTGLTNGSLEEPIAATRFYTRQFTEGESASFYVDMAGQYTLHEISLYLRQGICIPKAFTIDVWNGSEWQTAVQETGFESAISQGQWDVFPLAEPITGTWVRIRCTELGMEGDRYGMHIFEMRAVGERTPGGEDLALPPEFAGNAEYRTLDVQELKTSSASYLFNYRPHFLTDKNRNSVFSSIPTDTADTVQEIEMTVHGLVNEIILVPTDDGAGFPVDFYNDVWNGEEWVTVVDETGYRTPANGLPQIFPIESIYVDKAILTVTRQGNIYGRYGVRLKELELCRWKSGEASGKTGDSALDYDQSVWVLGGQDSAGLAQVSAENGAAGGTAGSVFSDWTAILIGAGTAVGVTAVYLVVMLLLKRKRRTKS